MTDRDLIARRNAIARRVLPAIITLCIEPAPGTPESVHAARESAWALGKGQAWDPPVDLFGSKPILAAHSGERK